MHSHQAIFSLLLLVRTVNLWELTGWTVNDAIRCQLSMRSKDKVGALSCLRDGRKCPSLSALHEVMKLAGMPWGTAFPYAVGSTVIIYGP